MLRIKGLAVGALAITAMGVGSASAISDYTVFSLGDAAIVSSNVMAGGVGVDGNLNLTSANIFGGVEVSGAYTPISANVFGGVNSSADFTGAASGLENLSAALAGLAANGTFDGTTFSNSGATQNVFNIQLSDVTSANLGVNVDANSTTVINVGGTTISWTSLNTFANPENVIFNFYEATSVVITSANFHGAVLAPLAHLEATSVNFFHQVVVGSLNVQSANFYGGEFQGEFDLHNPPQVVPTPIAAGVGLMGLLGLAMRRRRMA